MNNPHGRFLYAIEQGGDEMREKITDEITKVLEMERERYERIRPRLKKVHCNNCLARCSLRRTDLYAFKQ